MSIIVHCIFSSEVSYIRLYNLSYQLICLSLYIVSFPLKSKLYNVVQFVISAHMSIIVHCIFYSEVSYVRIYNLSYQPIYVYHCTLYLLWGPLWSWSYGSWNFNDQCNQCLSPLMLWVRICSDEVYLI